MESVHKTVLLNETIDGLNIKSGATVVDATFGGGGHSREICRRFKFKDVKIIAIDQDKSAWDKAKSKFEDCHCNIKFINSNFSEIGSLEKVDGIIFDLGLSSDQLENSGRGFSFMKREPLLMTMKENPSAEDLTAMDIVNGWSEKSLADIIYGYGEEKYRGRIAREIVDNRKKKRIETTQDLVSIIEHAVPGSYRKGKIHCATRTFQALRIAVNDELGVLERGLEQGFKILKSGGRMSTISFHSLEDRIVKKIYKEKEKEGLAKLINKKVILASEEELKINNRSRSAKLRILEKI
ncbi:MAG: 16S rRNA (cytosine(1402)-N(4))-methyltransferase RsmH [bacterium]